MTSSSFEDGRRGVLKNAKVAPHHFSVDGNPHWLPEASRPSPWNPVRKDVGALTLGALKQQLAAQTSILSNTSLMRRLPDRGAKILSRCEVLKKAISDRESLQAVSSTNEHGHENQLHQNRADVPATPVSYASAGVVGPLIITERTISTRKADVTPEISTVATSSAVTTAAALTVIESDVHAPSGAIISSHVDPPQPESVIDSSLSNSVDGAAAAPDRATDHATDRAIDSDNIEDLTSVLGSMHIADEAGRRIWTKIMSANVPSRPGGVRNISIAEASSITMQQAEARRRARLESALNAEPM